jgi:hypothetical protein
VQIIHRDLLEDDMGKRDSFFIRSTKDLGNTNTFHEKSIDLGAYVDAMNETVLRIHNISVIYSDNTGESTTLLVQNESAATQWQLTTQSQTAIVLGEDKSLVASGRIIATSTGSPGGPPFLPSSVDEDFDLAPQQWTNGYLVGVEQMYLGGNASTGWAGDQYVSIILECTVEKLTKGAAMALALSQQ